MKLIVRLQETFGFTRNEVKVILFLAGMLVLGAGIRQLTGRNAAPAAFTYAPADSAFAAASLPADRPLPSGKPVGQDVRVAHAPLIVNINTASRAELIRLPGIGPAIADRILRYRQEHGPFASVDGLDSVRGIGGRTLGRLRPFARVR